MKNIVIITSIIDIPKQIPEKIEKVIDYPIISRSIYTREERFHQTQNTISNIKSNIPEVKIVLVECSELTDEERNFFECECEWVINLFDDDQLKSNIYSQSKSLGEGTMMISALDCLIRNKIEYDNLFKITGRYWLNENFDYSDFENDNLIFNNDHITNMSIKRNGHLRKLSNIPQVVTAFYKINNETSLLLRDFLIEYLDEMAKGIQYEKLIGYFIYLIRRKCHDKIHFKTFIGVSGYIAIDGFLLNK